MIRVSLASCLTVVMILCAGGCADYEDDGAGLQNYEVLKASSEYSTYSADPGTVLCCNRTITHNPSEHGEGARDVAVDSTGFYVIGSDSQSGRGDEQWRIEKRNHRDGGIIWLQTNNPVQDERDASDHANAVALDHSALYVVGSDIQLRTRSQWRMEKRRLSDGEILWVQTGSEGGSATDVAVDETGLYVVGEDRPVPGGFSRWVVEKRALDDGGVIWRHEYDQPDHEDLAYAVALAGDALFVVGRQGGRYDYHTRLEKRNLDDGELVWVQSGDSPTAYPANTAKDLAVDATSVYLVGAQSTGTPDYQILMEKRDLQTGETIWTQTDNPSESTDVARAVAVDESGLYVAGYDSVPGPLDRDHRWRIEKRGLSDGALLWKRIIDPSTDRDRPAAVAVDAQCIHVVGSDRSYPDSQWRMERLNR